MSDLLTPGSHRVAHVADDTAVVAAMVRVEVAWMRALARVGAVAGTDADVVAVAAAKEITPTALEAGTEDSGNPVVPMLAALRARLDERTADLVHRGLTSQDVLDTALMLLARDALTRIRDDLEAAALRLAELAREHRSTVMAGRTLTQHAVPITFGLKAAQWLCGLLDSLAQLDRVLGSLPVQCGGAAGTMALTAETADPIAAARAFADELGLSWPGLPWHTNRSAVTGVGGALVTVTDALGVIASDVATLSRPEIGELREGAVPGRGSSSTMPHKRNPVLSVLVRSVSLQTPLLLAQLHLAAAQAVDERPDGAWHSEWPALRRLYALTATAASQTAELLAGLEVNASVMARQVETSGELLAESRQGATKATDYLGAASAFVDHALSRCRNEVTRS